MKATRKQNVKISLINKLNKYKTGNYLPGSTVSLFTGAM